MVGPQALRQRFRRGAGCPRCHNTGYHGRIGVFELLRIDTPLADALRRSDSAGFARLARCQPGFVGLSMAAYDYACQGITSMEEVLRVSGQLEDLDPVAGDPAGYVLNEDGEHAPVPIPGT
jgi:MSHA biogenesis protein MshE